MTHQNEQSNSTAPPESASTENEPESPGSVTGRIALAWFGITGRMNLGVGAVYLGAASLIGVEGLGLILGFTAMWPLAIPFVVGGLALLSFFRERLRTLRQRLHNRR